MATHRRDPWPERVVWHQDDVTHDRFYWLALEPGTGEPRSTITAEVSGQTITIESPDSLRSVRVRLHDRLVDLDQPIAIDVNGVRRFEGVVRRTKAAIERSLAERLDPVSAAFAEVTVDLTQ